ACDITFGTNNEFGFDYLRDNLAFRLEERVQRSLSYAIIDEVDSILIDEARTPLIISGPAEESTEVYVKINALIPRLSRAPSEESIEAGVLVHEVFGTTHPDKLRAADVIVGVNGAPVFRVEDVVKAVEERKDNARLKVDVWRERRLVSASILPAAADTQATTVARAGRKVIDPLGAIIGPLSIERRYALGVGGDYVVDEKGKQTTLTEIGHSFVEQIFLESGLLREGDSLYDAANVRLMHHLNAALRAHALYKRDVEYIVRNGEVIIVDEFTGRTMIGRRWSDGLHQAVEAKEGVKVREENQTVASITFQNYFRLYRKLAGMTGTADTEAPEFLQIYGLEVVVIPTHRPMIRLDSADHVYLTQGDKFEAIIADIRDCAAREQPVLVGTTSIETSEYLAGLLQKDTIEHNVLNAKQHEREAHIIAQAGRPGTVTIATNMAGRGTDIVLGGNLEAELHALPEETSEQERTAVRSAWQTRHDKVIAAGGLHIIGTERHESRRIDNQLRGRSGRQGDPGSSRFYLSMEDNLMRIFGDPTRTKRWLQMAGMKAGEVIESGMLTRQIEKAQRKVESHNFDIRKQLLLFDDVANDQRKVVYQQRTEILGTEDLSEAVKGMYEEAVLGLMDAHLPTGSAPHDWDLSALDGALERDFNAHVDIAGWLVLDPQLEEAALRDRAVKAVLEGYAHKVARIGEPIMRHIERDVVLRMLDQHWRDHLAAMDYLRQGIHLRGYAQKDYRYEYKREAFGLFTAMLGRVKYEVASMLAKIEVRTQEQIDREEQERRERLMRALQAQHAELPGALPPGVSGPTAGGAPAAARAMAAEAPVPFVRGDRKVGRNEPCPCGSGRKFKQCHGAL
ncbi:MAG TPA: preprotein translocase subunit SecA, partial [Steroidobacteraceae bacterium]|nr:preprotein translocase subunit SecA [Steroidobacteraceae bacterium]